MRPLRFAIIGTSGFAARTVAPALLASAADVTGVLGSTPECSATFASHLGARAYSSIDELVDDPDVDAVWVAAHDRLHEPFGIACLQARKHVLMEKPMATSAAGGRALHRAALEAGVTLRVGCHQRFRPVYRDLREIIAGGSLGTIGFARLQLLWEFDAERVAGSWRATLAESGGCWVLKELGAHLLDLLLWWTGDDAEVVGAILATQRFAVETEDSATVLLRLAHDGIGIVEVSAAMSGRTHAIEIQGTDGWIRARDVWRGKGSLERSTGERVQYEHPGFLEPYLAQIEDFTAAVSGGPTSGADGSSGVAVLELIDTALDRGLAAGSRQRG